MPHTYLIKSAIFGSTGVFAQTVLDSVSPPSSVVERLGTAGLLVVAAYFMLRYFMGEAAKKDALNALLNEKHAAIVQLMMEKHLASLRENQMAMTQELRDSAEVKLKLNNTLQELTMAVRGRRGDTPGL